MRIAVGGERGALGGGGVWRGKVEREREREGVKGGFMEERKWEEGRGKRTGDEPAMAWLPVSSGPTLQ